MNLLLLLVEILLGCIEIPVEKGLQKRSPSFVFVLGSSTLKLSLLKLISYLL